MPDSCANALEPTTDFVRLNGYPGKRRYQPARFIYLFCVYAVIKIEIIGSGLQSHDYLFKRRVARPFADAVYGALDLPCAVLDGRKRVRHRKAKVVMAVHAHNSLINVSDARTQFLYHFAEFVGHGIADCVRNVDGRRARVYHALL